MYVTAIVLLLIGTAVFTDLYQGKIYNMLVFPACVAGILLRLEGSGTAAIPTLAVSAALPLLLLPFWKAGRAIAAGDIKLLMGISMLLEPAEYLRCCVLSAAAGGILAVLILISGGHRNTVLPMALPAAAGTAAGMVLDLMEKGTLYE